MGSGRGQNKRVNLFNKKKTINSNDIKRIFYDWGYSETDADHQNYYGNIAYSDTIFGYPIRISNDNGYYYAAFLIMSENDQHPRLTTGLFKLIPGIPRCWVPCSVKNVDLSSNMSKISQEVISNYQSLITKYPNAAMNFELPSLEKLTKQIREEIGMKYFNNRKIEYKQENEASIENKTKEIISKYDKKILSRKRSYKNECDRQEQKFLEEKIKLRNNSARRSTKQTPYYFDDTLPSDFAKIEENHSKKIKQIKNKHEKEINKLSLDELDEIQNMYVTTNKDAVKKLTSILNKLKKESVENNYDIDFSMVERFIERKKSNDSIDSYVQTQHLMHSRAPRMYFSL